MGKALRDGYRKRAFLMTKYNGRTRASAAKQIDDSLRRLQTDHIDLIQFHENIRMSDADKYFARGGAHEAVMAAKKAGKVRFRWFYGSQRSKHSFAHARHGSQEWLSFRQLPDALERSRLSLPEFCPSSGSPSGSRKTAVLGMKPLASGLIFGSGQVECD